MVTVAPLKGGLRLVALNKAAAALGLKSGLALADARARHPAIIVVEADEAADAALLKSLAERCERYTPLLGLDPPDGLTLDITGCAHLFGGEEALRRDALGRLQRHGFGARAAIAETPGTAWALARFGEMGVIETGHVRAAILPLPLAALRLPPETCQDLRRVGLARIADIINLPRSPLTARFGAELMLRLDQALGRHEEALAHLRPPAAYVAERIFAEPLEQEEDILATAEALTLSLGPPMERGEVGARVLELALFRVDGEVNRLRIGASRPVRNAKLVRRLFTEKITAIEGLEPGYGFDVIRLSALVTTPLAAHQLGLGKPRSFEADLELLIDRLAARLGSGRLIRLAPRDSHVPERAVATCSPSPQRGEGCAGLARSRAYPKLGEGDGAPAVDRSPSLLASSQKESSPACRPGPLTPAHSPRGEEARGRALADPNPVDLHETGAAIPLAPLGRELSAMDLRGACDLRPIAGDNSSSRLSQVHGGQGEGDGQRRLHALDGSKRKSAKPPHPPTAFGSGPLPLPAG